ncbi:MAG: hypothetical protein AAFR26_18975 [Cyanobacteria bacterium J06626_4]|mgnify:CR=1 FL=1
MIAQLILLLSDRTRRPSSDKSGNYREPHSDLDTFNRRLTGGEALPGTLNPAPFYPLLWKVPLAAKQRQGSLYSTHHFLRSTAPITVTAKESPVRP